jgi:hypothetical protein
VKREIREGIREKGTNVTQEKEIESARDRTERMRKRKGENG